MCNHLACDIVITRTHLTSVFDIRRIDVLKLNAFSNNIARLTFVNSIQSTHQDHGGYLSNEVCYTTWVVAAKEHDKLWYDACRDEACNWKQLTANAIDRFTCPATVKRRGEIAGQSVPEIRLLRFSRFNLVLLNHADLPRLSAFSRLNHGTASRFPTGFYTMASAPPGGTVASANGKHRNNLRFNPQI